MNDLNLDGLTDAQLRLFAVRRARRVQHLMVDPRSVATLDVAERHAKGEATDEELAAARAAAWAATRAATAAARAAAEAARAAAAAARAAAWAAAEAAARAAEGAVVAAEAAKAAADAARDAERAKQQKILEQIRKEVKP